jgi:hypothetical protein
MVDAWPNTVNTYVKRDSDGEEPEEAVLRSITDIAPPKLRPCPSIDCDLISFEGRFTEEEWVDLQTFYKVTLLRGSLPFTRVHPLTGAASVLFLWEKPPRLLRVGTIYRHVAIELRQLP